MYRIVDRMNNSDTSRASGPVERDIEQAVTALKKGAYLLKYGRRGKPKFCPFRLANFLCKQVPTISLVVVPTLKYPPGQGIKSLYNNFCNISKTISKNLPVHFTTGSPGLHKNNLVLTGQYGFSGTLVQSC